MRIRSSKVVWRKGDFVRAKRHASGTLSSLCGHYSDKLENLERQQATIKYTISEIRMNNHRASSSSISTSRLMPSSSTMVNHHMIRSSKGQGSTESLQDARQEKGSKISTRHVFTSNSTAPGSTLSRSASAHASLLKGRSFTKRSPSSRSNASFTSPFSMMSKSGSSSSLERQWASDTDIAKVVRTAGTGTAADATGTTSTIYKRQRNQSLVNYQRKATLLMAQRSNAHGVKELVSTLRRTCDEAAAAASSSQEQDDDDDDSTIIPPFADCAMLAQIGTDAYYRVVIGSADGVNTLIKAMSTFPHHAPLQEVCCRALGNLCERNGSNQLAIQNNGGIQQIVSTMQCHGTSIAVQSAACEALQSMTALILAEEDSNSIVQVLSKARDMYITPQSKASADQLLIALQIHNAAAAAAEQS